MNNAGEAFGLQAIVTHTLRKTFGYHMYQQTHDEGTIKDILNKKSSVLLFKKSGWILR